MSETNGDEFDDYSAMELWLHDLSVDSATRVAGALMIFVGSLLGVLLGIALISANVGEILTGQLDGSDGVADVDGLVSTALEDGTTGGEPAEGIRVSILDSDNLEIGHDDVLGLHRRVGGGSWRNSHQRLASFGGRKPNADIATGARH